MTCQLIADSLSIPKNFGSTDFKRRFEDTKTMLKICPARTDTRANGRASCRMPRPVKHD